MNKKFGNDLDYIAISYSANGYDRFTEQKLFSSFVEENQRPCISKDEIIDNIRKNIYLYESDAKRENKPSRSFITQLHYLLPHYTLAVYNKPFRSYNNFNRTELLKYDIRLTEDCTAIKKKLMDLENTLCLFLSPNEKSLVVIFRFDKPITDLEYYSEVRWEYEKMIIQSLGLTIESGPDYSCGIGVNYFYDMSMPVSYDPDLYLNKDAVPLPKDWSIYYDLQEAKLYEK